MESRVLETRICANCGLAFDFTEGEAAFYKSHGLTTRPNRCSVCRAVRRIEKAGGEAYVSPCVSCGTRVAVPFQPHPGKQVSCQACYSAQNDTPAAEPMV